MAGGYLLLNIYIQNKQTLVFISCQINSLSFIHQLLTQPDSQATCQNNTTPSTIEFGLPSMDAEQPVIALPSGGHTANSVAESPSAQQPSVGEGRSNRRGTGTGQRSKRKLNQGRDSGRFRRGTGSTPASLIDAEQPVAVTPTHGHAAGIVDKLPSAQQLSAGEVGSNTGRGGRRRTRGCRWRGGGRPRQRAVSTPVSVV